MMTSLSNSTHNAQKEGNYDAERVSCDSIDAGDYAAMATMALIADNLKGFPRWVLWRAMYHLTLQIPLDLDSNRGVTVRM
jgi:hypothetical protein